MSQYLVALSLFVWTAAAVSAPTQDSSFAEATVAVYEALSSYCDEVTVTGMNSPDSAFTRCFTNQGRYKVNEQLDNHWRNQRTRWGDRTKAYAWHGHRSRLGFRATESYTEESPPSRVTASYRPPESLTGGVLQLFRLGIGGDSARIARVLADYQFVREADGLRHYAYHYTSPAGTEITHQLRVRPSDGIVVGAQENWGDVVQRSARVNSVRLNPSTDRMDLAYVVPWRTRAVYSLMQDPVPTTIGLALFAFVAGFLALAGVTTLTGRAIQSEQWRWVWKRYTVAAVICAVMLGLPYVSIYLIGLVIPFFWRIVGYAPFVGVGFIAVAMFLLGGRKGSRLADRWFAAGRSESVNRG